MCVLLAYFLYPPSYPVVTRTNSAVTPQHSRPSALGPHHPFPPGETSHYPQEVRSSISPPRKLPVRRVSSLTRLDCRMFLSNKGSMLSLDFNDGEVRRGVGIGRRDHWLGIFVLEWCWGAKEKFWLFDWGVFLIGGNR